MLFDFLVLSFGFLFTYRMVEFQINRKPLSEALSRKIAQLQILYFWFLTILSPWTPTLVLLLLLLVPNLVIFRIDWILNFILRHQFEQYLLSFFDEIILLMMSGQSFRDSFHHLTRNSTEYFHIKLRELFVAGHYQSPASNFKQRELIPLAELFHFIEKNPHKAIDKLKAFRRQLNWSLSFKRKAKQATVQIRAQALVLSLLYLGLLIFVIRNYGSQARSVIGPSLFLFFLGLLCTFLIGRRKKWKT